MQRRDNGQPIRDAMRRAGLDGIALAARTREVDPEGRGLGKTLVGYAVTQGKSGRDEFSARAAGLIAAALGEPVLRLFDGDSVSLPTQSTFTRRARSVSEMPESAPDFEDLLDVKALCKKIRKSRSWVYQQKRLYPLGHAMPFPVHYVGRAPRFRPNEVLAWNADVYPPRVAA